MRLLTAIITFFIFSFVSIYIIDLAFESKSYLGNEISKNLRGENGLEGFLYLIVGITCVGALSLIIFLANKELNLKILKEIKTGGKGSFLRVLKLIHFGDKNR